MLNRIINHQVKATFIHYRYGKQVSNPFRTLSIPELTKLMNSSQKKSGSFFILIYKALLKGRVTEKVRGQVIFNKEQIEFSNYYIKILSLAIKDISPQELIQILELLAKEFRHRNFKIERSVFDQFMISIDIKVEEMIKNSQENQKYLKIIIMKWLQIAKAQKIIRKIVSSLIKSKLLTKEDCIDFLQKIATFPKNQNIIVSEISLKIISYLFQIEPEVNEEILFNTFDRYGLSAKRYEEDLFKKIKAALFRKIKEQQQNEISQYQYILNYLKYESLLQDTFIEDCQIVSVLHTKFLKYFQKLTAIKSCYQRSQFLKCFLLYKNFLLRHPYYAPEPIQIMNQKVQKSFTNFMNQFLKQQVTVDDHAVTLFLLILKEYNNFLDSSIRQNFEKYLIKYLDIVSSKEERHVVQSIRIYEFLAHSLNKVTDKAKNENIKSYKNILLRIEKKNKDLTYYEAIRIRNASKVIDFELPQIEEVYQHIQKNNPLAVLENISRSILCSYFEETLLKLSEIILSNGKEVQIITALIVSFKAERNKYFSEKIYRFWWKDNLYNLLKKARLASAFTFYIKFIEKEFYTIEITDLHYLQELLFNLVSLYPSIMDRDNQQNLIKPINSVFQFTFWDQILLNQPNQLFVYKFISVLTLLLRSDSFGKYEFNVKSLEKYIDILLKYYEYSKNNLIAQALETLIIKFLPNVLKTRRVHLLHHYYWISVRNSASMIKKPFILQQRQDLLSFQSRLEFNFFKEGDAQVLKKLVQKSLHKDGILAIIPYPNVINQVKGKNISQIEKYFFEIAQIQHKISYYNIFMILHVFNKFKLQIGRECYDKMRQFFLHQLKIMKQFKFSESEHFQLQFSQFDTSLRNQPEIEKLIVNYKAQKKIDIVRYFYDYTIEMPQFSFIDYFKYLDNQNLIRNFFQLSLQGKSLQFFMVRSFGVLLNRKSIQQLEYFLIQFFPQIKKEYQRQHFTDLSAEILQKIIMNCQLALQLELSTNAIEMVEIIKNMANQTTTILESIKNYQSKLAFYLEEQLKFDDRHPLGKINGKYTYFHAESNSEPISCDTNLKISYLKQVFPETHFEIRSLFQRN